MPNSETWDLIIIGGGAAGFFSAITCAEASPNKRILIVEKTPHVLGKVKISGGGRCNVTHACFDPKPLTENYPRGNRSLIGPFHRWGTSDTVDWFQQRGVELKTEADGRMFPTTDSSQTIIDCLTKSARDAGVCIRTSTAITSAKLYDDEFLLETNQGGGLVTECLLIATGGTRLAAGAKLAEQLGHQLTPNVPSLFAFDVDDPRICDLPGVSVPDAEVSVIGKKLTASGPLLITHRGMSGPGVLRLSAWGARELHKAGYQFEIKVNWLPNHEVANILAETRQRWGKRQVSSQAPFDGFPKRLWKSLYQAAAIPEETLWSQLTKQHLENLTAQLTSGVFQVSGKSINKDEFVTCGGVHLKDINLTTMESKLTPSLYFAGEVLDIDGITGGFNFQNAWTNGHLAGTAIAEKLSR